MSLPELPHDAITALERGNKIEAIKAVRQATGLGLKEAKDAVEAHLESNAALRSAFEARAPRGSGCGAAVLAFLGVAGVLASHTWL